MPNAILVNNNEVPPILIKGKGWPVTGNKFTATAILIIAWNTRLKLHPKANNVANARGL
jgi:hypothetical protein